MLDILSDTSVLSLWLLKYGSVVLFIILSLGIIALPFPEETLMIIAGVLMHKGKLNILATVLFAYAGTITGISVSYIIGRTAGIFIIRRYGGLVGIDEGHLLKAHYWFERLGKWVLTIGYFIPGVRHLSGFCAGTSNLKYSHFALYAYSGAIIWVSLFLSLGYFVGTYCLELLKKFKTVDLALIALGVGILLIIIFILKKKFNKSP
jgi:membrane protein DedA with SNARE-associated domain